MNTDCQFPLNIGDGFCNDFNNNRHCEFDGGDCCGPCVNKLFCSKCECKTGDTNEIRNALVGNGFCNDETNNEMCNFDGGDCCGTCVNTKYCSDCECGGQNSGFNNAFLDDGFCQDQTNHGDCMFDGNDCCGYDFNNDGDYNDWPLEFGPGDDTFCSECTCHGKATSNNLGRIMGIQIIFCNAILMSNPLDSQKTKLLKTKTVDFSINNKQFSSNHFKNSQNNNTIFY